jgi:hypothetical protein
VTVAAQRARDGPAQQTGAAEDDDFHDCPYWQLFQSKQKY